jgi:CRP/FNR family transcriptional regulator, cyclic AMP receptor protein
LSTLNNYSVTSLANAVRSTLLSAPEISRLSHLRRSTGLFGQGQSADAIYFIEDGLVKMTRTSSAGGRIILTIRGSGDLVGEEALLYEPSTYYSEAEVLTTATIYRVPRAVISRVLANHPQFSAEVISYLVARRLALAEKVELLCLRDVEYRILHYLAELSRLVSPAEDGDGYQIPITQLELADLIGATRETTSTTLNQLERRGLLKLSRRMLTIPSPGLLASEAAAKRNGSSRQPAADPA